MGLGRALEARNSCLRQLVIFLVVMVVWTLSSFDAPDHQSCFIFDCRSYFMLPITSSHRSHRGHHVLTRLFRRMSASPVPQPLLVSPFCCTARLFGCCRLYATCDWGFCDFQVLCEVPKKYSCQSFIMNFSDTFLVRPNFYPFECIDLDHKTSTLQSNQATKVFLVSLSYRAVLQHRFFSFCLWWRHPGECDRVRLIIL